MLELCHQGRTTKDALKEDDMNTIADVNTHGSLSRYMPADDIAALYRSGERYTEKARDIILHGERGNFRSDADAELYIMNGLASINKAALAFNSRIVVDKTSHHQPSQGIAIVRRDGRFAVMAFTEYTNDGRTYDLPTVLDTEEQARNLANGLWVYNGF